MRSRRAASCPVVRPFSGGPACFDGRMGVMLRPVVYAHYGKLREHTGGEYAWFEMPICSDALDVVVARTEQ